MSIVLASERAEHWVPRDRICFYCGSQVPDDGPLVIWVDNGSLLLHPDCARRLGTHLICDSREAELASGRQPWTRRAGRVLRAAAMAEEVRT